MSIVRKFLNWLNDVPPCDHKWRVLLEHYPTYAYDWWKCDLCGADKQCVEDEAPVKVKTDICSLGYIHIVN